MGRLRSSQGRGAALVSRRAAIALLFPLVASARKSPSERVRNSWGEFAESGNNWANRMKLVSPFSPNFLEESRELFINYRLGELFRKFEQSLQ
jgi:hypothetical protein